MAAMSWKGMKKLLDRETLLKQLGLEARTPGSDFLTGLGLFFAPHRGEDMRAMVSDRWRTRTGRPGETSPMGAEAGVPPTTTMGH